MTEWHYFACTVVTLCVSYFSSDAILMSIFGFCRTALPDTMVS